VAPSSSGRPSTSTASQGRRDGGGEARKTSHRSPATPAAAGIPSGASATGVSSSATPPSTY
jgi:hypothetical protein